MSTKKCTKCLQDLELSNFIPKPHKEGKYLAACKRCTYELYGRPTALKKLAKKGSGPKIKLTPEERKKRQYDQQKVYRQTQQGKQSVKRYNQKNKNKIAAYNKQWKAANKVPKPKKPKMTIEEKRAKANSYYHANKPPLKRTPDKSKEKVVEAKIKKSLRRRLRKALKGNKKTGKTVDLIGCTSAELRLHLQNQFTEGMSWGNYGEWHIDHIRPMCSFDLTKEEDQRQVNHYFNLRPLWAKENLLKALDDIKHKMTASVE
jgi:hypothetical protein